MNAIAAIAVTLLKAQTDEFREYAKQVLVNSKTLADALMAKQVSLITGGTDNHMMVIDTVASFDLDGRVAEEILDKVAITTNKQIIPDDPNPPLRPSGIRLGSPAATTRGMKEAEMVQMADWIVESLRNPEQGVLDRINTEVAELCLSFPVPGLE